LIGFLPNGLTEGAVLYGGDAAQENGLPQLQKGDAIRHRTFGSGMVLSVRPMGNDALVEVAFDGVGTKKLMLKVAGAHITKLYGMFEHCQHALIRGRQKKS